jgi:hypothetical protein
MTGSGLRDPDKDEIHKRLGRIRLINARFSIANAQQVLPLAEFSFEVNRFSNIKGRNATLGLIPAFSCPWASLPVFPWHRYW